jgi:uncharacterized protein YaiE (UPF0345 family)
MKQFISHSFILIVGLLMGGTYIWVSSYLDDPRENKTLITLEEVFKYSNTQIESEHFSCEGETGKTVGAVVGSIYDFNNQNTRNMVSFGCFENTCVLSISDCKPWQSQECGSRLLRFEINTKKEIDPTSFTCIDVP